MNLCGAWCHVLQRMGGIGGLAGEYEYCSSWGQAVIVSWGFGDGSLGTVWHGFWAVGDIAIGTEASLLPNNVFLKI